MMIFSEADKNSLTRGHCPKCGSRGFVLGPQDGASINIECASWCRARYNVALLAGHIIFAEKIPDEIRKRVIQRPDAFRMLARLDDKALDKVLRHLEKTIETPNESCP